VLKKIVIKNDKVFRDFELELNQGMNVVVGDNDVGKSNLLEALNLALTGRLNGVSIATELSPFLMNQQATHEYIAALRERRPAVPPEILIEIYFDDTDELAALRGDNNSLREQAPGVKLRIALNDDFLDEYSTYIADPQQVTWVPTEYYQVQWLTFASHAVTQRGVPAKASMIDATIIRLQTGADAYLQAIIGANLDPRERVELTAPNATSEAKSVSRRNLWSR
jgi:putative ATP-dependent endonuclease of OLD family